MSYKATLHLSWEMILRDLILPFYSADTVGSLYQRAPVENGAGR